MVGWKACFMTRPADHVSIYGLLELPTTFPCPLKQSQQPSFPFTEYIQGWDREFSDTNGTRGCWARKWRYRWSNSRDLLRFWDAECQSYFLGLFAESSVKKWFYKHIQGRSEMRNQQTQSTQHNLTKVLSKQHKQWLVYLYTFIFFESTVTT